MEPIGLAGQRRALLGQLCVRSSRAAKCRALGWAAGRGHLAPAGADAAALDAWRTCMRAARSRGAAKAFGCFVLVSYSTLGRHRALKSWSYTPYGQ